MMVYTSTYCTNQLYFYLELPQFVYAMIECKYNKEWRYIWKQIRLEIDSEFIGTVK